MTVRMQVRTNGTAVDTEKFLSNPIPKGATQGIVMGNGITFARLSPMSKEHLLMSNFAQARMEAWGVADDIKVRNAQIAVCTHGRVETSFEFIADTVPVLAFDNISRIYPDMTFTLIQVDHPNSSGYVSFSDGIRYSSKSECAPLVSGLGYIDPFIRRVWSEQDECTMLGAVANEVWEDAIKETSSILLADYVRDTAEREARHVNSGGIRSQINYIKLKYGAVESLRILRESSSHKKEANNG